MADPVYFWQDVLGDKEKLERYKKTVDQLRAGNYQSAGLERLRGTDIYSVRTNDKSRLLFTTITIEGKKYLLLLQELPNHEYNSSKFLKKRKRKKNSNALKAHLAKYSEEELEEMLKQPFEANDGAELPALGEQPADADGLLPAAYYNNRIIGLNAHQKEALVSKKTIVLRGGPGSGKSLLALSLLFKYTANLPEGQQVLYVTSSVKLVKHMRKMWRASPEYDPAKEHLIQFITYRELALKNDLNLADKIEVGDDNLQTWLKRYASIMNMGWLANDMNLVYQEFRLISGYSQAEYFNLGEREGLFRGANEQATRQLREHLFKSFEQYNKHLITTKSWHPAFHCFKESTPFHTIVCDESQDFSGRQILNIKEQSSDNRVCCCMDTHQSLLDNRSQLPFLQRKLATEPGIPVQLVSLPGSYRCPASILKFANKLIRIKYQLTGGLADKDEKSGIELTDEQKAQPSKISWISNEKSAEFDNLLAKLKGTIFAVVTLPEFVDEAKRLYPTKLIFTADQIKGLEFNNVVLHRMMDSPIFREANKCLPEQDDDENDEKEINRPKQGRGEPRFGPPLNSVFTAATRTTGELFVFQPTKCNIPNITSRLKKFATSNNQQTSAVAATKEQWLKEAKRQWKSGNKQMALDILKEQGIDPEEASFIPKRKTQAPASVIKDNNQTSARLGNSNVSAADNPLVLICLEKLENIFKLMPPETLFFDHKKNEIDTIIADPFEHELLYFLFKKKPHLLDNIKPDELIKNLDFLIISKFAQRLLVLILSRQSIFKRIFVNLFLNEYRFIFLNALLSEEKKGVYNFLFSEISASDYCRIINTEYASNISPLFLLTFANKNPKNIAALFTPAICSKITFEALCGHPQYTKNQVYPENSSVFYFLSKSEEGQKILLTILNNNPDLANKITMKILYRTVKEHGEKNDQRIYDNLSKTSIGNQVLTKVSKTSSSTRNLFNQSVSPSSKPIVKQLSEADQKLKKCLFNTSIMTFKNCCDLVTHENFINYLFDYKDDQGKNLFHLICTSPNSKPFINAIEEHPECAKKITAEILCKNINAETIKNAAVFSRIIEHNKEIARQKTTLNSSVFNEMAKLEDGIKIIGNMHWIYKLLPNDILYRIDATDNMSLLYRLGLSKNSKIVRNLLIAFNPNLVKNFPKALLMESHDPSKQTLTDFLLDEHKNLLLNTIFEFNPGLSSVVDNYIKVERLKVQVVIREEQSLGTYLKRHPIFAGDLNDVEETIPMGVMEMTT